MATRVNQVALASLRKQIAQLSHDSEYHLYNLDVELKVFEKPSERT